MFLFYTSHLAVMAMALSRHDQLSQISSIHRAWLIPTIRDCIFSHLPVPILARNLILSKEYFPAVARHLYRVLTFAEYMRIRRVYLFDPVGPYRDAKHGVLIEVQYRLVSLTDSVRILDLRGSFALRLPVKIIPFASLPDLFPNLRQIIATDAEYHFALRTQSNARREVCVIQKLCVEPPGQLAKYMVEQKDLGIPKNWKSRRRYHLCIEYKRRPYPASVFDEEGTDEESMDDDEIHRSIQPLPCLMKLDIMSFSLVAYWLTDSLTAVLRHRESAGYKRIERMTVRSNSIDANMLFYQLPPPCDHYCLIGTTGTVDSVDLFLEDVLDSERWEQYRGLKSMEIDVRLLDVKVITLRREWSQEIQNAGDGTCEAARSELSEDTPAFVRPLDLDKLIIHIYGDPTLALRDMRPYSNIADSLLRIGGSNCRFVLDFALSGKMSEGDRAMAIAMGNAVQLGVKKEVQKLVDQRRGGPGWRRLVTC
jgi:hypothetical protein